MSRIVEINSVSFGSTGNIMMMAAEAARKRGHVVMTICPNTRTNLKSTKKPDAFFGYSYLRYIGYLLGYYTGYSGCFSVIDTFLLLKKIKHFNPDIIHLHNLHQDYINIPLLFRFIKKRKIRTIMTLHDCWTMTGGCAHFSLENCDKWKTGCYDCAIYRLYPSSWRDNTKKMYSLKKKWFDGVQRMDIITPSNWLGDIAKESFLGKYPIHVINNGINLEIFRPLKSDFRRKHNLENHKIILGVAFGWGYRKGLDVFIRLSKDLSNDYKIVLVGTDDQIDSELTENIVSIHRTENQQQLCEVYSAADVFANPTREEVLGLVNIEALACGTPVVTFRAGGSPECIDDTCGMASEIEDYDGFKRNIEYICEKHPFSKESCIKYAKKFDQDQIYSQYVDLYDIL